MRILVVFFSVCMPLLVEAQVYGDVGEMPCQVNGGLDYNCAFPNVQSDSVEPYPEDWELPCVCYEGIVNLPKCCLRDLHGNQLPVVGNYSVNQLKTWHDQAAVDGDTAAYEHYIACWQERANEEVVKVGGK